MSDILALLREAEKYPDPTVQKRVLVAVEEIESLREEVEKLKSDFMQAVETELERHRPTTERLRAEVEKLRAALNDIVHYTGGANNALEDEYVMERAASALKETKDDTN